MANGMPTNQYGPQGVSPRGEPNNVEYQRIYGTGNRRRGQGGEFGPGGEGGNLGEDLSDWERQSNRSGRSQMS